MVYDTKTLVELCDSYMIYCKNQPTKTGLAHWLSISHQTVNNIINGTFNGFSYTDKPHVNRIVANKDFAIVRGLFTKHNA